MGAILASERRSLASYVGARCARPLWKCRRSLFVRWAKGGARSAPLHTTLRTCARISERHSRSPRENQREAFTIAARESARRIDDLDEAAPQGGAVEVADDADLARAAVKVDPAVAVHGSAPGLECECGFVEDGH